MNQSKEQDSFLQSFEIVKNDVISFIGAGGKTSLIFRLAEDARRLGFKTLVTTTTHMLIPQPDNFDALDLSGALFRDTILPAPGIYVGGVAAEEHGKMAGVSLSCLENMLNRFDLILIEADGAAGKPLKGWKETEPVIPLVTTKTIGIIDIQTIGCLIDRSLVHRLEIFLKLSRSSETECLSVDHLRRVINNENGLFSKSQGAEILYVNKRESASDEKNAAELVTRSGQRKVVCGSIRDGIVHVLH